MEKLSVILPTLNEEGNIKDLVARLHAALSPKLSEYELIFIDDHSTDRTREFVESLAGRYPITCHLKEGARGKALSLLEGFARARFDYIAMIDADLQYPPEAIPEMIDQIESGFDVVVAHRMLRKESFLRNFVSKSFAFFFVRLLHGFKHDVQAGLKMFRQQIIREVKINPTPWTFDLGFLVGARRAGYKIGKVNIVFDDRRSGESKVNLLRTSCEIGASALRLKFRREYPISIHPEGVGMAGAGLAHRGRRFITHTTLHHHISAIETAVLWQKLFLILVSSVFILGLVVSPPKTAIVLVAILSSIYFIDVVFNLFLVIKSLQNPPEIRFSREELTGLNDRDLPTYTILSPLYREKRVLPGFLTAIEKLDWPKDKLDVLLLLEEDDIETIEAVSEMSLPSYIRFLIVPHSMPKTKPKACNYGLSHAKGEYLVIYDAEDVPDPEQLKKAYLGFGKVAGDVRCLQAKLNYYNPHDNFLTRLFTAEYSLWFDMVLTGLQSINTTIPLGGTSNHFRTKDLIALEGWDPFNVTEDCDLGVRLFKQGARTAIIDSVTLEEANSNLKNWIRQRSRWIKGYMQTYLVHMRHPFRFLKENGVHALIFQLNVGGKIAFMFINPILWAMTIAYFAFYAYVGSAIEALYPPVIFYLAATSLIFGNFMYLYNYMIGAAKRSQWTIIKYVFFIPVYWLLASVASVMALWQLISRPHYWEKTHHGLHILRKQKAKSAAVVATIEPQPAFISGGTVLIGAMMISNGINFLFNAYLGRVLSFADLGLVTFVNTLWYIAALFIGSLSSTVNHKSAYLAATESRNSSADFRRSVLVLATMVTLGISIIWVLAAPFLSAFFKVSDPLVLLLFTPVLISGVVAAVNRGYLQGTLSFSKVAAVLFVETAVKFLLAFILVNADAARWVYLAIPGGVLGSAFISILFVGRKRESGAVAAKYKFPSNFFVASLFSGMSATVFLSLDIILVKHFFPPEVAGQYVLLSLVGKMIYFFGSLPNVFMITFVSRSEGLKENPKSTFYLLLVGVIILTCVGVLLLGPLGGLIVPVLLGSKTLAILPYLTLYTLAIAFFTVSNTIVSYHLARKHYFFPVASVVFSITALGGIIVAHGAIADVVNIVFMASALGLGAMTLFHLFESQISYFTADLIGLFRQEVSADALPARKRVLIFNWRDTRHVYAGGAENYIQEIAKRWVAQGNSVTIFCGNDRQNPRYESVDGVDIVRRGGFYLVYVWAFLYYMFRFRGRFDVIIDCENGIPFFAPLYAREPVFCLMHHVHQEVFRKSLLAPLAVFARFLEKDLMPLVYRNVKFITVSPSSKKDIEELGLGTAGIEVVYPGVDIGYLGIGIKSSTPTVLYLGRLKFYKSVDILIKAFALLRRKVPEARLIIAGSGEEEKPLKKLARDLSLDEFVEFKGKVTEEEKVKLLQRAWVFANPSFMEGWGITTIEANICGTPVVAADVPGLRYSVQNPHTGLLVPHGDPGALAESLSTVIQDEELRLKLSQNALVWAQRFDWQKTSQGFLSVLQGNYCEGDYHEMENII